MQWFTSDEHLGHANIIKYTNRPFKNVDEMNDALIANHNSLVKPEDEVYHLGDFAFRNHANYLRRLNGKHFLIKGNHEGNDWRNAGFVWVKEVATVRIIITNVTPNLTQDVFLSHYAHRRWNRSHHNVIHLYGHSHGQLEGYCKSMDVGVDTNNYFPYSAEQIVKMMESKSATPHHD